MSSLGIDQRTGAPLTGWEHTRQSISIILLTAIGERIQRRDFGSSVPEMLDRPQNEDTIVSLFVAVAEALHPRRVGARIYGEPRFRLTRMEFTVPQPGEIALVLDGIEYPDGHRNDFERSSERSFTVPL